MRLAQRTLVGVASKQQQQRIGRISHVARSSAMTALQGPQEVTAFISDINQGYEEVGAWKGPGVGPGREQERTAAAHAARGAACTPPKRAHTLTHHHQKNKKHKGAPQVRGKLLVDQDGAEGGPFFSFFVPRACLAAAAANAHTRAPPVLLAPNTTPKNTTTPTLTKGRELRGAGEHQDVVRGVPGRRREARRRARAAQGVRRCFVVVVWCAGCAGECCARSLSLSLCVVLKLLLTPKKQHQTRGPRHTKKQRSAPTCRPSSKRCCACSSARSACTSSRATRRAQ